MRSNYADHNPDEQHHVEYRRIPDFAVSVRQIKHLRELRVFRCVRLPLINVVSGTPSVDDEYLQVKQVIGLESVAGPCSTLLQLDSNEIAMLPVLAVPNSASHPASLALDVHLGAHRNLGFEQ